MKLKLAIPVIAATLGLAGPAAASTRHLEGAFRADPDATIAMDVVIRHDRPAEVRHLRLTGLDYACESSGSTGEIDASLGSASFFRSARGGYEFEAEPAVPGLEDVIAGGLMGRSTGPVKGGVAYFFTDRSGDTCQSVFDGRFVAR